MTVLMILPTILFVLGNIICAAIILSGVNGGGGKGCLACAAGFNIFFSVFNIIFTVIFMIFGVVLLHSAGFLTTAITNAIASSDYTIACVPYIANFINAMGGWMLTTGFMYLFMSIGSIGAASAALSYNRENKSTMLMPGQVGVQVVQTPGGVPREATNAYPSSGIVTVDGKALSNI
jgi:hypothetical protein